MRDFPVNYALRDQHVIPKHYNSSAREKGMNAAIKAANATSQFPSPGLYRHYKGGLYRVCGKGKHTERALEFVVYVGVDEKTGREAAQENGEPLFYLRPASMWNEMVVYQGKGMKRFTPVETGAQDS